MDALEIVAGKGPIGNVLLRATRVFKSDPKAALVREQVRLDKRRSEENPLARYRDTKRAACVAVD